MKAVIFIMGVTSSGKTTIGQLLSLKVGIPFFDGDDFHPPFNREKMSAGHPLNDEDRQEWLQQLNVLAIEQSRLKGAIIACSGLKEKYRAILSLNVEKPTWIFLQGTYELIYDRMKNRTHFMPVELLQSQFDILEIPANAFTVNINDDPHKIVEMIMQYLNFKNNSQN